MQYINTKSLSFWAGALLILAGLALGYHMVFPIGPYGDLLQIYFGSWGPGPLMLTGAGLIGIRRAIAREVEDAEKT